MNQLSLHHVVGLRHVFRHIPTDEEGEGYNLHRLIVMMSDGSQLEIDCFCEHQSTPAWPESNERKQVGL